MRSPESYPETSADDSSGTESFNIEDRQSTVTWATMAEAEKFRAPFDAVGPKRALEASGIGDTLKASPNRETVGEYLNAYISSLIRCTR